MTQLRIAMDTETYPNVFTIAAEHCDYPVQWGFEISPWRNDNRLIIEWLYWIKEHNGMFVTFNGLNFDWPIMDLLLKMGGKATAADLYAKAMEIIKGQDGDRFAHTIYPKDRFIPILDEFKLHHFDNKAKSTSLKALEFNMRMDSIEDLPFPVGTVLTPEQTVVLRKYNAHDVTATKKFYMESLKAIQFREELAAQYNKDFLNFSDVKIGKEIFQMALENRGVSCYEFGPDGRVPRQTLRPVIHLRDALLPWINLETPGFKAVLDWMRSQSITETKNTFKDITVFEYGLNFVFGTGGLHAAVDNGSFVTCDDYVIESKDVASYYPNLAIKNKFYPEHLGVEFCNVYEELYELRKTYAKGTPFNAAIKLALNGSFGASNSKFSIFYDPLFTMKITINGQLLLCMLIEQICKVPTVRMIMTNTDGIEYLIHPNYVEQANKVCDSWCQMTGLVLEGARYKRLFVSNVNNYIGEFLDD